MNAEEIKAIIKKHSFPEIDNDGVHCRSFAEDKIDEMVVDILSRNLSETYPKQLSDDEILNEYYRRTIAKLEHSANTPEKKAYLEKEKQKLKESEAFKLAQWVRDRTGGGVDEQVERFKRYRYLDWKIQYGRGLDDEEYEQYEELREEMRYKVADYLTQRNQQEKEW